MYKYTYIYLGTLFLRRSFFSRCLFGISFYLFTNYFQDTYTYIMLRTISLFTVDIVYLVNVHSYILLVCIFKTFIVISISIIVIYFPGIEEFLLEFIYNFIYLFTFELLQKYLFNREKINVFKRETVPQWCQIDFFYKTKLHPFGKGYDV